MKIVYLVSYTNYDYHVDSVWENKEDATRRKDYLNKIDFLDSYWEVEEFQLNKEDGMV